MLPVPADAPGRVAVATAEVDAERTVGAPVVRQVDAGPFRVIERGHRGAGEITAAEPPVAIGAFDDPRPGNRLLRLRARADVAARRGNESEREPHGPAMTEGQAEVHSRSPIFNVVPSDCPE